MTDQFDLRLLFACGGSYVSGAEIVELSVMRGLQARGHTVRCLTNAWNDSDFHERLDEAGIPYRAIPLGMVSKSLEWKHIKWTLDALIHLPIAWHGYWQELRRFRPDLVVHSSAVAVSLLRPLIDPGKTVHHVHQFPGGSLHSRRVLNGPENSGCAYVAVSRAVGQALVEQGVPENKVHVVHNGVELPAAADAEVQGSNDGTPVRIGIVGQIGAWKGHDDLIEALHLLQRRGCSFACDIVGTGDDAYVQALKTTVARYGLQDRVRWRGFVKDTAAIYAPLDVCAVPSRFREPFGLVAVEPGRGGLPVVAARRGGLSEIVVDGETGFLVEAEHPEQLANRLATLIENPALRREMGRRGRERALQHFTRERMVEGIEEVLLAASGTPLPSQAA